MAKQKNKVDSLAQRIEIAEKDFEQLPSWMKSVAYVSSAALPSDTAKRLFEATSRSPNSPHRQKSK